MSAITTDSFFKSKRDTSEIKSEILVEYFKFWCSVLLFGQKFKKIEQVVFIDLFSGPGRYESGDPSTPLKIIESIYNSTGKAIDLNKCVRTFFNDQKKGLIKNLDNNLTSLDYYEKLGHKPILLNHQASKEVLNSLLEKKTPSLTFIDPFGYSYSMEMLLSSVREWGSDLFMLFNINRIRAAIRNPLVEKLMNQIFQNKLFEIRAFYEKEKNPAKREKYIIERFEDIFREKGYFIFKFRINFPGKDQSSHYLYLVTKVVMAYQRIKEIMKKYSDFQQDGVPLFTANFKYKTSILYGDLVDYSIYNMEKDLVKNKLQFNNKSIEQIYEVHSTNTNYIKENYKQAISGLIDKGFVKISNNKMTYTSIVIFN